MNNKKKVLFFTPGSVGGSERMTVTIAKFLPLDRYNVKFVIVDQPGAAIEKFIPDSYPIIYLKLRNIWDFTILRMAKIMHKEKPDYVFCSLRYMAVHMIAAAKMVGGIECIVRSDNDMHRAKKHNVFLMKLTFPFCKWIIAQQDEMRQELLDWLPLKKEKVITLQNPLDITTIAKKIKNVRNPFPTDENVNYVWVGRFNLTKGQDILTKAFSLVKKRIVNAHLYLVGSYDVNSEVYRRVMTIINSEKMTDSVHLVGYDNNPYRWMKFCSCFVLPSRFEGLPNALVEAMYIGCPVVATRCIPIIDRIVDNGKNGYVVESENVEELARRMVDVLSLKKTPFIYHPAKPEDFINLFC